MFFFLKKETSIGIRDKKITKSRTIEKCSAIKGTLPKKNPDRQQRETQIKLPIKLLKANMFKDILLAPAIKGVIVQTKGIKRANKIVLPPYL